MIILKPLLFKTVVCLCLFSLFACGGSGGSESGSNTSQLEPTEYNYVDLRLNWTDNSENETEFVIERRIESNVDYGTTYYVDQNTTSYDDLQVESGETYCYRISASNYSGSSPSNEVCIDA